MRQSVSLGMPLWILVLMLLVPWSSTVSFSGGMVFSETTDSEINNPPLSIPEFIPTQPVIWPAEDEWWQRGDELSEIYVITRDLASLDAWQQEFGYSIQQSALKGGQQFIEAPPTSGIIEHRKMTLPAYLVPKLLGLSGMMSIFEDPGSPEPFSSNSVDPLSVRTGELHGAPDSWDLGVDGAGVKVAVVDSGIDFAHPDLNGTQARVNDSANPYDGWPIMWDPRSVDIWMQNGDAYPDNSGSYYSDTSNTDLDTNNNSILDSTGFDISGISPSLSGIYHHGLHPDSALKSRAGGEVDILVVDDLTAGVYDTVYIDIDRDGEFSDEKAVRKGSETAGLDTTGDGLWDQSAGLLYWISDGVNGIPYGSTYAARAGFQNRIAAAGNLTLFMIDDQNDPGGNHGTLCASAVSAQGEIANGKVLGMAPNSELIAVADFYAGGSFMDAWRFLAEGYDGVTDSGDEAQIGSFSFGWSNIHNDGTDQMSLYVDWLTRVHARNTTYLVAAGNGGHGYGTTASPGGAHGVITVGAFSSQTGQSHGGTWGDAAAWSNRGPNSASRLDPDIVTVGWSATGDRGLNEVTDANSAYRTWGGTSLATPIAAGLVALIYDAWFEEFGVWPDSQTVRDLLMSTADDRGYDPLVQGGGFANISRAVQTIQAANGSAWVTPASWMAGSNHGAHRDANTNILSPGQSAWANFTVNGTGGVPVNLSWDGANLEPTSHFSTVWNSSTSLGWDGYQSGRPDMLIPVHIKGDANLSLPNGTSIVRARATLAGAGFDGNDDMYEENRVHVELLRWHDDDGDGLWWDDSNNNSLVDSGEMEAGSEYSMITAHTYASGQAEVRVGLPHEREGDGLLLGVYRRNIRTDMMDPIPIEIDWTGFGPSTNTSWLTPCAGSGVIPANGTMNVNCRVSVPVNAIPGIRQEQVKFEFESNNSSYSWSLPVIVNVASNGPVNLVPKPIDGNMSNQSLYTETWIQGAQRWGWRSESGDWKFLTFDWPYNLSQDGAIVIDVDWPDNSYTDVDVIWMSESRHPYYLDDPNAYGQYNLVPEISSQNEDIGSGKYRWQTSTGGSHEVLVADATSGMKQMMLHSIRHGVNTNDNPLNISVGYVNAVNGSLTKVVDDWANGDGNEIITIGATLDLNVSSVEGFGWTQPVLLPSETATQDTPGSWSSSGYQHEMSVQNSELLKVEIDSISPRTDLDLALYRDKNSNGVIDFGSEQIQVSGNWNSDEEISIDSPTDGTWWAVVNGYDVPNGTASFWLRETILAGDSLTVEGVNSLNQSEIITRYPNGSSALGGGIPMSAFDVNLSYEMPSSAGNWQGYLVVNLASGGSLRLSYDYRLEDLPPILEFSTPLNMSRTNQSIPLELEAHDFGNGFNLSALNIDTHPLVDWANESFTLEAISERDGGTTDYAESWIHWNSVVNESSGSHFHVSGGSVTVEVDETTSTGVATDNSAPNWVVASSPNSSNGQYLTTDSDTGWASTNPDSGPRLDYSIDFSANGTYYVWIRVNATDVNGHAVHIGVDESPITSNPVGMYTNSVGSWEWTNMGLEQGQSSPVQFEITSPGRHNINIWPSEDGISIDQLIITDSWSFVPSSIEPSISPYIDLTLRSAWLNLSLPEDNGWRTFSAEVMDYDGRENSSTLMVEFDDLSPPIIISGWNFFSNNSQMPISLQTDIGAELWFNNTLIELNETGSAEIFLSLHPTYWAVGDGDPNDASTWEWVNLNTFQITARDLAGNWNHREFDVVYDEWGAHNNGPEPQIVLTSYSGISDGEYWLVEDLLPPDRLNVKQTPLRINVDAYFDTKQVCAYFIDEGGIERTSACISQYAPPWGLNDSSHLREGAPPPPSNIYTPFSIQTNHSGLSDGSWQIFIETLDWAGNWGWENFTLLIDREEPQIAWQTPIDNSTIWDHRVELNWNISEISNQSLVVDGVLIGEFAAGDFSTTTEVMLDETGWHQFCILASDITIGPSPNIATDCIDIYLTPEAYIPTLEAVWNEGVVNSSTVFANMHIGPEQRWSSQVWDGSSWNIQNGSEMSSGDIIIPVQLTEGENMIRFEVEAMEQMYLFNLSVLLDSRAPHLTISSPEDGISTPSWFWNLTGECESGLPIEIILPDASTYSTQCNGEGYYFQEIEFDSNEGLEMILVSSVDLAGNTASVSHTINVDRTAPHATLKWVEPNCETKPVSTISNPEPVATCHLALRADFLHTDIYFWSLSVEHEKNFITSQMGILPEEQFVILSLDNVSSPGLWEAELIIEDAAGNRQTVMIDTILSAEESSLTAKISTPASIENILAVLALITLVFMMMKHRSKKQDSWQEVLPTPLDPELFDEGEGAIDDEWDIENLSIPSSHGPVGAPPSNADELIEADAMILQQVKDTTNK
ncbi:MAG: S8 family serine peptidase [Euryarchaeota archaeon]|nr:S8 family serine peptidase [Euryarchaeota archaeon]